MVDPWSWDVIFTETVFDSTALIDDMRTKSC